MRRSVFLLTLVLTVEVLAQTPKLTWIRFYRGPGDVLRHVQQPFDQLLANKHVLAWGVLEPMASIGEPWSKAVYVTVADWASLERVQTVFSGKPEGVHDVVLRHVIQSEGPGVAKPKYVVTNFHPVARGRDSDAYALFNEWAKPVFLDLQAKGKLGPWGLLVQTIVLDNEWTYLVWYFIKDLSTLDDIDSALAALGPSKLGTFERRLREMSEDDYEGQVLRVVHSAP